MATGHSWVPQDPNRLQCSRLFCINYIDQKHNFPQACWQTPLVSVRNTIIFASDFICMPQTWCQLMSLNACCRQSRMIEIVLCTKITGCKLTKRHISPVARENVVLCIFSENKANARKDPIIVCNLMRNSHDVNWKVSRENLTQLYAKIMLIRYQQLRFASACSVIS